MQIFKIIDVAACMDIILLQSLPDQTTKINTSFFSLPEHFLSNFHHLCRVIKYMLCILKNDTDISWELILPGHMSQLPERCNHYGCSLADGKHMDLSVLLFLLNSV